MSQYYGFPEYVPVAKKRENNAKAVQKLKKKQVDIQPIVIKGNKLATTWWAIAWNKNLESYADYDTRLTRGRSYVRNGAVLDLKITQGKITACVQGSGRKPYQVQITIKAIEDKAWQQLIHACEGKIDSLEELIQGKFPKALGDIFTSKNTGLFPKPKEIELSCNCPDWAMMCKHVAATLYGVGARLDENPELFFTLRSIDIAQFIESTTIDMAEQLLRKSQKTSQRIIKEDDISELFDID